MATLIVSLEAGADYTVKNKEGKTVLDIIDKYLASQYVQDKK